MIVIENGYLRRNLHTAVVGMHKVFIIRKRKRWFYMGKRLSCNKDLTDAAPEEMVRLALEARKAAYAPYSGFRVGAAVLADNGGLYTGCNIENASFGATICAERTAIGKAVSEGAKRIRAVAIASDSEETTVPCGICRQVMSEFCEADMPLYLSDRDGSFKKYLFRDLLPNVFILKPRNDISKP